MQRIRTALVVVVSLGVAGGAAALQDRERTREQDRGQWMERKTERFLDRIDATEEQRTQIRELHRRMAEQRRMARDEKMEIHREMMELWNSEEPDREQVQALVDRQVELFREGAQRRADAGLELHGILTPEQRNEVTQMMEEHHRKMQKRMEKRMQRDADDGADDDPEEEEDE